MASSYSLTDTQRKPPAKVAVAAERGLRLREKFDRGGTEVGVRRAHQLKDRRAVSDPSAGYIAWLLWGGDPAEAWIGRLHARLEKADA
jgi:hypothetical protein